MKYEKGLKTFFVLVNSWVQYNLKKNFLKDALFQRLLCIRSSFPVILLKHLNRDSNEVNKKNPHHKRPLENERVFSIDLNSIYFLFKKWLIKIVL